MKMASRTLGRYRSFTRTETTTVTDDSSGRTAKEYDHHRYDPEYEKEIGGSAYFQHNFSGEDHKLRAEFIVSHQPELEVHSILCWMQSKQTISSITKRSMRFMPRARIPLGRSAS